MLHMLVTFAVSVRVMRLDNSMRGTSRQCRGPTIVVIMGLTNSKATFAVTLNSR